jgi:transcription termination factor 2
MPLARTTFGDKTLMPHQVTAVEWMMGREADGTWPGGLLCDEMGLGKTVSTVGLLLNLPMKHTLLLAPLAVLRQWRRILLEAKFNVLELEKHRWVSKGNSTSKRQVYITNYDKLTSDTAAFSQTFHRLVCDEAHILRNDESKKYKVLQEVKAMTKWFLTGTPIVNRFYDLVSLLRLLNPRCGGIGEVRATELMGELALYRTQDDLKASLKKLLPPEPEIHSHRIDFTTEKEATFYRSIQGKLLDELDDVMAQDRVNVAEYMVLLLRLRQISVHPQVYINGARRLYGEGYKRADWGCDSSKMAALIDVMKGETENCGYVIFCHFADEMEVIQERLKKEGFTGNIFRYHGGLSASQRADLLEVCEDSVKRNNSVAGLPTVALLDLVAPHLPRLPEDVCKYVIDPFRGGKHTILLAQIHSAGTGLNLQFMNRVVFTTPWWTAALMDQAVGRVLRLGQTKKVHVHYLMLSEEMDTSLNIDDYINERVEMKRALCQRLLDAANRQIITAV